MEELAINNFFIGVQLIAENAEEAIIDNEITGTMKMKINNLQIQCAKIEAELWSNMSEEAQIVFNQKVKNIEVN